MKKFIIMALCARWVQRCDHKRCLRREWLDRWYDYMFAAHGPERLQHHTKLLHDFYSALNAGQPALLDISKLRLAESDKISLHYSH